MGWGCGSIDSIDNDLLADGSFATAESSDEYNGSF